MKNKLPTALAFCAVTGVLDGVSTMQCINRLNTTSIEANPWARWCIDTMGGLGQIPQRMVSVGLAVAICAAICQERSRAAGVALWAMAAVQATAATSNWIQLSLIS